MVLLYQNILLVQNQKKRKSTFFPCSNGILVIEASTKSGTFITVDFALEQGKNVYAIPRKYF